MVIRREQSVCHEQTERQNLPKRFGKNCQYYGNVRNKRLWKRGKNERRMPESFVRTFGMVIATRLDEASGYKRICGTESSPEPVFLY